MDKQVITKELAESAVLEDDLSSLRKFSFIEDDAAEFLSRLEKSWLSLYGLKELSDLSAKSLSRYRGDLSLNGLTFLTGSTAATLSKHEGR